MKKVVITAILVLLFLTSCYTTKVTPIGNIMSTWMGASKQKVMLSYGPPTRTSPDGAKGEIYTYENSRTITMLYPSYNRYLPGLATSDNITYYINFYFNSEGNVYYWRTNYPDNEEKTFSAGRTTLYFLGIIAGSVAFALLLSM